MKLTVLTENVAGPGFLAEHGLSYLIEVKGETILFDTGSSDVFLENGKRLGIDIVEVVNTIVLSHGHWDHGDGLRFISGKTLITHPDSFMKRYRKKDHSRIGLGFSKEEVSKRFKVITSKKPHKINEHIIFLGEIPRLTDFEAKTTQHINGKGEPDFVPDDSALAIIEDGILHVVTGCSHAGICNIVNYAIKVTGIKKVKTVIGGFHLKHDNEQTRKAIQCFKELNIETIFPSHCTELPALCSFSKEFSISQLKTGMVLML